jgi:hypothetical protein
MCGYYAIEWSRPIVTRSFHSMLRGEIYLRLGVRNCGSHSPTDG